MQALSDSVVSQRSAAGAAPLASAASPPAWALSSQATAGSPVAEIGGKARGLLRLAATGHSAPPWFVIPASAFRSILADAGLDERIRRRLAHVNAASPADVVAAAKEIGGWIRALEPPPGLADAVARSLAEIVPGGGLVAARSSAPGEDSAHSSLAGLHHSVLPLAADAVAEVLAGIREVWASAYSEPALAIRLQSDATPAEIAMAVVVQRLVEARTSGVLFTADPVSGDVGEMVISALYGSGEALVGEGLDADRFRVRKDGLSIRSEIAAKQRRRVFSSSGVAARWEDVPEELRERASLDEEEIAILARAALEIERTCGRPQDVEFAVDGSGEVFFLQTRPIVTVEEYGPAAGHRCLWDVENWAENYPGVTLPLTYSLVQRWDRIGRRCLAAAFGIDARTIRDNPRVFDAQLGYVRGRIASNRLDQYRFFRLVPGFDFNRPGLLKLLRFRPEEVDPALDDPLPGWRRRFFGELPPLLRLLAARGRDFGRVRRQVAELLETAESFYERCAAVDFRDRQPYELIDVYEEAEVKLVWTWKVPMLNALFLRLTYVVLKKLTKSWCGDENGSLVNELMRDEEGSASGQPLREMLDLAAVAAVDPALRELFANSSPLELAERVTADPAFAGFAAAVEGYLERYPFKSIEEMKLESETLRDRPEILYLMLRSYVLGKDVASLDPAARRRKEETIRQRSEKRARQTLRRGLLPRRWILFRLLATVRALDREREAIKFMRLRLIGLMRQLARALGERLAEEGILERPRDVFYLGIAELRDYVRGNALGTDLAGLVALRRAEVESWREDLEARPDDRFETYGTVYHKNRFRARPPDASDDPEPAEGTLRGTGCCEGTVTATVAVLDSPTEAVALRGQILAVERLHTGWISAFPSVAGLLVERGEILSHSTTVAREMGIPTIVGIPGLLATIRGGERVTLDGSRGTVFVETPSAAGHEA